jgi:hypothetical protein
MFTHATATVVSMEKSGQAEVATIARIRHLMLI